MPEGWSAQSDDDFDDFNAWRVRRNAQVALRQQAETVARNLWNQSPEQARPLRR
jgi:hypothetical protein